MANIDQLKSKLAKLEVSSAIETFMPKGSGWLSRKLLVVLAVVGALIVLGRDNQAAIINGIIILGAVYVVCQAAHDIFQVRADAQTRQKLIEALAKDGLTVEELGALNGPRAQAGPDPRA